MPPLRNDRERIRAARQKAVGDQWNLHRRRISNRLSEKPDHVVEVDSRTKSAVPPGGIAGAAAHRRAGLAFLNEPAVHRSANEIDAEWYEWIEVVIERIAKRRREDHSARRAGLMMVVDYLRIPRAIENAVDCLSLRLRGHV